MNMEQKTELFDKIEYHLLNDEKPSLFLNTLIHNELFCTGLPFTLLSDLINTPQSPIHHPEGSVWNHTLLVTDQAAKRKSESDNSTVFMWSALLHDIGKAKTTNTTKGKITSYNHESVGAELVVDFFLPFSKNRELIDPVARMIRWHMQPLFVTKNSRFAQVKKMKEQANIKELALLGLCDRLGRKNADEELELKNINQFIINCREDNKKMTKLRMGVIGIGMAWERLHYPALQQLADKYEIVAVCDCNIDKAKGFAWSISLQPQDIYDDYNKLLQRSDIDVIDLLVPIENNFEIAKAVIGAKKNLIAEKPFAASVETAEELIQLKNQNNVKVMVAENFRYEEENTMIKELLSCGAIGEVLYFIQNSCADFESSQTKNTFAATEWRQHPEYYGGVFLDGSIHDIARMRFLFGDIDTLYATGRPQDEEYNPYISINALIKFKNNVTGQYSFRADARELQKPPIGLRLYGTLGEICLESKDKGTLDVFYKDGRTEQKSFVPGKGYYYELLNFYEEIHSNAEIVSTPEKEVGDIKAVFDIFQSIQRNEPIR